MSDINDLIKYYKIKQMDVGCENDPSRVASSVYQSFLKYLATERLDSEEKYNCLECQGYTKATTTINCQLIGK